jgi:hypothetical protein
MFYSRGNLTFWVLNTNFVDLKHTDYSKELADLPGAKLHFHSPVSHVFSQGIAFLYLF